MRFRFLVLVALFFIQACSINSSEISVSAPDSVPATGLPDRNVRSTDDSLKRVIESHKVTQDVTYIISEETRALQDQYVVSDPPKPKFTGKKKEYPYNSKLNQAAKKKQNQSSDKSLQTTIEAVDFDSNAANVGSYFIPADPSGAAGTAHVMNVVNTSIEIYTRAGALVTSESLDDFFSPVLPANNTFDPKVLYDQYEDRFVVVTLEKVDSPQSSSLLLAVSHTGDPTGGWNMTRLDVTETIGGELSWWDYPGFAIDEEAVYITGNMFSFSALSFTANRIAIFDKGVNNGFYDSSAGTATSSVIDPGGNGLTKQPAHVYGSPTESSLGTFLVGYNGLTNFVDEALEITTISSPLNNPVITTQFVFMGDVDFDTFNDLPDAPQSGTTDLLKVNDRKTLNAVLYNDDLFTATTVMPASGDDANQATALWVKMDATLPATVLLDDIGFIGGEEISTGTYTFFPSIAVNSDGGVAVGFSASSPDIFPGAYMAVRSPADAAGTTRAPIAVRSGLDYYYRNFGGSNRWGDYSGASLDPDSECFWIYNKYALVRGNPFSGDGRWGTAYAHFCNSQPVTADDQISVAKGGTATVLTSTETSLLFNDSDTDAFDTLSVNVTPATAPLYGTLTLNADGTFSYTHDNSGNGPDSFQYTVCDDGSPVKCAVGTVDIEVTGLVTEYTIGGNVTGLAFSNSVVLRNNGADDETVNSNTTFTFSTAIADGQGYAVTVFTQPTTPDQTCTVTGGGNNDGSGTVSGGNVTDIQVSCQDDYSTAVNDSATLDEDSGATIIDVLANDSSSVNGPAPITAVTQPTNGTVAITNAGADLSYTPNLNFCNDGSPTDDFTYTITGGSSATVSVSVTCVDDPAVANDDGATVNEDSGATIIDVLDNDTDVEGDSFIVTEVTQPTNGTVAITNAGADLSYTPDPDYCNGGSPTDDFNYTITGGDTATVIVSVTCVEDNPVAVDDSSTVSEDSVANFIDVLDNDTDVDGGTKVVIGVGTATNGTTGFTVSGVTYTPDADYCNDGNPVDTFTYTITGGDVATVSVTVTCVDDNPVAVDDSATVGEDSGSNAINVLDNDTDIDNGPKEVTDVGGASFGTTGFTAAGVTYTPNADYCNDGNPVDTFTYTITGGDVATVSVTVTCVDDNPVAVDDSATVDEDSSNNLIAVLDNDTDVDGGPKAVTGVGSASHGFTAFNSTNAIYTPGLNYCGSDSFTYTITGGSTATINVTVTCIDDNPVAVDDSATVNEDSGSNSIDVLDNDTDIDGGPKEVTIVSSASHGSTAFTAAGVTYTPDADYCGFDFFEYTITGGDTGFVDVTVNCVNDAPDFVMNSDVYIDVDNPFSQLIACQFDMGPNDEDGSQSIEDFQVSVASDTNGVITTADVLNNGVMQNVYSGNQGDAIINVTLRDNGGTANGGTDLSPTKQITVHVQDYIFQNRFEVNVCQ